MMFNKNLCFLLIVFVVVVVSGVLYMRTVESFDAHEFDMSNDELDATQIISGTQGQLASVYMNTVKEYLKKRYPITSDIEKSIIKNCLVTSNDEFNAELRRFLPTYLYFTKQREDMLRRYLSNLYQCIDNKLEDNISNNDPVTFDL